MEYKEILKECDAIQAEIETLIPSDLNNIIERAKTIAAYKARVGYLYAEAKKIARIKKTNEIADVIFQVAKEGHLSAKVQNALVDSIASDEMYLVDWTDRIGAACVYQIDLIRSIISKEKEELRIAKTGY